jgi:hypothetical protein
LLLRKVPNQSSVSRRQRIEEHREGIRSFLLEDCERAGQVVRVPYLQELEGEPELVGRSPCRAQLKIGGGGPEDGDAGDTRGGATSFSSSSRLEPSSGIMLAIPVTLPPGRPRLATSRSATGSPLAAMTMGIVLVACFAARCVSPPAVTMMSTFIRTSSSAIVEELNIPFRGAVLDGDRLAIDPT